MSDKIPSQIRTGFGWVNDTDTAPDPVRVRALVLTFMEEAVKNAATYVTHSGRSEITARDIQMSLRRETFVFLHKNLSERMRANFDACREGSSYGTCPEIFEDEDGVKVEEDEEIFRPSLECTCSICVSTNYYDRYWTETWEPQTPLEHILKRAVDNIPLST